MRDNALAAALKRKGHSVTLIPLYTPLRSEQSDHSVPEVFYGGINVYLQHATKLFRHTPRVLDWILDRPWLLNAAGRMGAQTPPEKLAGLTLDIIEGEDGSATKELDRLVEFLRDTVKPAVVSLPNVMFIGMARTFRRELGVPVVCELTGEDIFLDAMNEQDREKIREVVRARTGDVTRFVATSAYYADHMADYLAIPREQIDVVYTGISQEYFAPLAHQRPTGGPPTIGYLARICSEKGLSRLVDAVELLLRMPGLEKTRVKVAGYLGSRDQKWFEALQARIAAAGIAGAFEFLGEVDRDAKLKMLDSIDVFSVPTAYPEAKGIYVLEAMARGVPVVQPAHGSFPELLKQTGGGLLVPPGDPQALAEGLARLLRDSAERRALGSRGRAAVEANFTEGHMADNMLAVFEPLVAGRAAAVPVSSAVS